MLDASSIQVSLEDGHRIVNAKLKRCLDCVMAVLLLLLLSPLLVLLVIFIKLDSHGPALFRHLRVGKGREGIFSLEVS